MLKGILDKKALTTWTLFLLVTKMVTIKVLLALTVIHGWSLTQLGVNNAFLHGDLHEEVYVSLPPSFHHVGKPLPNDTVCKLHKSLYGLKQASRQWFSKFSNVLLEIGFKKSSSNSSLFIQVNGNSIVTLLVYIDDIVITRNYQNRIDSLKKFLDSCFKLKDLWDILSFS